jgi:hypothetical protein
MKMAVLPPTRILAPLAPSALGMTSLRRCTTRLVVAPSCGAVVGYTMIRATLDFGPIMASGATLATPDSCCTSS